MTDLNDATPMEDRVDHLGQAPVIEKAASDQLARTRVKVDRYSLPKAAASQP